MKSNDVLTSFSVGLLVVIIILLGKFMREFDAFTDRALIVSKSTLDLMYMDAGINEYKSKKEKKKCGK